MMIPASTWNRLIGRLSRAIPAVLLLLWLVQLSHWLWWETGRRPVDTVTDPSPTNTIPDAVDDVVPVIAEEPGDWPESPFTPPDFFRVEPEPEPPPEMETDPDPPADPTSGETKENPKPPPPPPRDPAEALRTFHYQGFMQTPDGNRIAFIEDKKNNEILRLQIGNSVDDWELTTIARDRIIFVSEGEAAFELLRGFEGGEAQP